MKIEELSRLLLEADPAAVLAPKPVLTRVIQAVTGANWVLWRVPHDHCFLVDRFLLFKYVEPDELRIPADHRLPNGPILLIEQPTADQLGGNRGDLLVRYWRLLFHASAHRELEQRLARLSPAGLRERIDALGPAAFEEARNVLVQDGLLPAKSPDRAAYIELAAYFFELRYFNPNLLPVCFPSLPPAPEVEALLGRDIDAAAIYRQTRLDGAPDPAPKTDDQADESHDFYYRLARAAQRASRAGDTVGAAILHTRAARVAPAALTGPAQSYARQDIHALVGRLQKALDLTDEEAEPWRRVLPTLLDKADQGARPVEASLLYDLQRACLDHEQKIYALDVGEWLLSAGHKPIRRELEGQKYVRVPAQLRSATRRLPAVRLNDADRQALGTLLRDAQNRAEARLRERFRPVLTDALEDTGLRPGSLPERAALNKTVEELLDRISAAGFLSFGDVRDAIARGQMKLPDLTGPHEYIHGDPLLRLDRQLSTKMDGVYRRAESYTRGLERVTAFGFGTETGRWVTRNILLPFGVAFLVGQFVWLMVYERLYKQPEGGTVAARRAEPLTGAPLAAATKAEGDKAPERAPEATGPPPGKAEGDKPAERAAERAAEPAAEQPPDRPEVQHPAFDFVLRGWNAEWWFHLAWLGLGLFLLAVIRSAELRRALASAGRTAYRAARFLFWDLPARVWANPLVRAVVTSMPVQLAHHYAVKPLVLSGVLWAAFPDQLWTPWPARIITLALAMFVVNTRIGRAGEAVLWDAARGIVDLIRSAPAVLRWINDLFQELTDAVEWVLARTEDWLRIRGRGGRFTVALKAAAGVLWMPFAFLLRFYTVVLIEPMLNPLKLPLSILFAKFVYPLLLLVPGLLVSAPGTVLGYSSPLVEPLARYITEPGAWLLVMGTLWLLPDAFTFLFWEMRENWRLYRANNPPALRPVMVGSHGETVEALLHYGFHSGTVPRLFAKLRAAERLAAATDDWKDARTYRQALRGVEEAVRWFVTRDFTAVLNPSPAWAGPRLTVARVELGTNRIRIELVPEGTGEPAWLEWEDRSGWLVAGWGEAGFLDGLPAGPARVLENALAYLYKRAGVDISREQVRAALPPGADYFDITRAGLLVWYGSRESPPVLYDLADPVAEFRPRNPEDLKPVPGTPLSASRLLFARLQITWAQWAAVWQAPPGQPQPRLVPGDRELSLLPPKAHRPAVTEPPAQSALAVWGGGADGAGHAAGQANGTANGEPAAAEVPLTAEPPVNSPESPGAT